MILAPLLLEEEPLEEIRGADDLAVAAGEPQVRDAGVEVLDETLDDRRQLTLLGLDKVVAESGSPRRLRFAKKAVQLAVSSFVPGARWSSTLRPSSVIPQTQSLARQARRASARRPRRRTHRRPEPR